MSVAVSLGERRYALTAPDPPLSGAFISQHDWHSYISAQVLYSSSVAGRASAESVSGSKLDRGLRYCSFDQLKLSYALPLHVSERPGTRPVIRFIVVEAISKTTIREDETPSFGPLVQVRRDLGVTTMPSMGECWTFLPCRLACSAQLKQGV